MLQERTRVLRKQREVCQLTWHMNVIENNSDLIFLHIV